MRTFILLVAGLGLAGGAASQACIDSTLIDPFGFCPMIWDPVCGCNGVTYGNSCEAEVGGGVTSFVPGECSGAASDCYDLGGVDFGVCDMAMGVGVVDGTCAFISGCGWEVNGVNYSTYGFETMDACTSACGETACMDLFGVDFGACAMAMGVAFVDGSCVGLSGCGWVVNGVDYSVYSFESIADCDAACGVETCIDPALADPLVDCNPFDPEPVCGCDSLTHLNPCFATYVDWVTSFVPGPCAGDCYDPERVAPLMPCSDDEATVCGCDGFTYLNPCQAWHFGGIASWTAGPCATDVAETRNALEWSVQRLEGGALQLDNWPLGARWRAYAANGQLLGEGMDARIASAGWHGLIVLVGPGGAQRTWLP